MRVVQAFGRERSFTERFWRTNEDQYHANMETVRISAKYFPFIEYAGVAATAVIVGYGGWLVVARRRRGRCRRRVRALPPERVRPDQPAQPALQHGAVGRRGDAQDLRRARHAGLDQGAPGRGRPRRATAGSRSTHVTFAYGANEPVLHDVSLADRAGRAGRVRRPDRRRQVDARQARSPASTTRPRARSASAGSTCATRRCSRCATASSSCRRRGSCSRARSATTCASAGPTRPTPKSTTALEALGLLERFRAFPDGLDMEVRERGLAAVGR